MDSIQPSGTAETTQGQEDKSTLEDKMLKSPQKFDPLDILPEEIWIAIIAESASEMRHGAGIIISQDTLIDLMQVSRLWNIRISSSATLWVDIILEDEYDAVAKAYLALNYSKQVPLALYMHYPTGWWDILQEHIVANRARITKLFFSHHVSSFEGPIMLQISPLPCLATLHYGMSPYPSREDSLDYLLDSPIAWTNFWLDRGILERKNTRELRGIRLSCELEDVFDLLEESEYLQEVLVYPKMTGRDVRPTLNVKDSFLQGPPLPWMTLHYSSDRNSFLGAIIARLPKLVELRIRVSQKLFCHLVPLIFQLENLSSFDVTMRGKWDRFERLVIPQASTSVRNAAVDIGGDISPVMEPVVDALFRCLPNIQHLNIWCRDLPPIRMLASSTGFQYLKTLSLSVILEQGDTLPNSDGVLEPFATSVERVSYLVNGPCLQQLIPVQSCHIKHLEISCSTLSEMDMYSQRWTEIRIIELDYNTTVNWKGPTYQHLHTISLRTVFGGATERGGRNVTKLCRDIALHPEYFPALSKLEFETCPELDILLILLEVRNVAPRAGVSPILTLVIPTRCPPFLVERLRELVKGIKHGTSCYYDLSIAGSYDIITDPLITGCADCHRAVRFCTQPVKSQDARFPEIVMEYPESVAEILETWDVRADKWYPVEEKL